MSAVCQIYRINAYLCLFFAAIRASLFQRVIEFKNFLRCSQHNPMPVLTVVGETKDSVSVVDGVLGARTGERWKFSVEVLCDVGVI